MSTYSEATQHLDNDSVEVEFSSDNSFGNDGDRKTENCNGQKSLSEITIDDIKAMEFSTEEEAIQFYKAYARFHGFAVRKDDVVKDHEGKIVARRLLCNKEGKCETKNKKNEDSNRQTMRTGCLARLRVAYDFIQKIWKVTNFEPNHNHELSPPNLVHLIPNYRKLSESDKQIVSGLHSQGVRTCHILGFLMGQKGGHENLGFIKKDLYNYTDHQGRVRIEGGDTFATLSYFQGKADNDSTFFSEFTFTNDGRLENIFWADSASRLDYECFGDVVLFDATYKKNRYDKPLVIFTGYNHHGETTIFACALISDEKIESYKWVLNMFSKAMYEKHPKAIVTDGDKSMRKAIRVVFPNSRHRLCSWHLHQNARVHVKDPKFLEEFNKLMYSNYTPEQFESEWKRVVDSYGVSKDKWVIKTYKLKRMWASSYMRDHFVCGVRTTSICEGVNSFIRKYVQNKNSLVDFLHNFGRAVKDYRHNELLADFKSFYYKPVLTTSLPGFEREASEIFTFKKFLEVKKAIKDVAAESVTHHAEVGNSVIFRVNVYRKDAVFWVHFDKEHNKFICDCRRFERERLPCSHIISVMKYENMDAFPESLICKRWSKTIKKDHISSFASKEGHNEEKMVMFRRWALTAAFNRLCEASCNNAIDYEEALEGINSLCDKINVRREGNVNGKNKVNKSVVGDPDNAKPKGAPKMKKSYINRRHVKERRCSRCKRHGHTIRRCPILAGIDVTFVDEEEEEKDKEEDEKGKEDEKEYEEDEDAEEEEEEEEEVEEEEDDTHVESEYESNHLNVSLRYYIHMSSIL